MQQSPFVTEPTFWTTTNAEAIGYNVPDRTSVVVNEEGKRVRVRHPQSAHQGDYVNVQRIPGEGRRYVTMCRHDGHVVYYTITTGAADVEHDSPYAKNRIAKARALGWFPMSKCPCALIQTGELSKRAIVDKDVRTDRPCEYGSYSLEHPCPHAIAERDARRAVQLNVEIERERAFTAKQDRLVQAQQQQTDALVKAQADATKAITEQNAKLLEQLLSKTKGKASKDE